MDVDSGWYRGVYAMPPDRQKRIKGFTIEWKLPAGAEVRHLKTHFLNYRNCKCKAFGCEMREPIRIPGPSKAWNNNGLLICNSNWPECGPSRSTEVV